MKREWVKVRLPDGTEHDALRGRAADPKTVDRVVRLGPRLRRLRLARAVRLFLVEVPGESIRAEREDVLNAIKRAWPLGPRRPVRVNHEELFLYVALLRHRGLSALRAVAQAARDLQVTERHVRQVVKDRTRTRRRK
jgi:hypothetical protein